MVGIGYRKDFAESFFDNKNFKPDFIEVAPENWVDVGGYWKKLFLQATESYPLFTHGLSLSIGSPDPIDMGFLKKVKSFLKEHNAQIYSEHISYSKCDNAHLYDLMPMPFTVDAVRHISERIKMVQDFLEQPIAMEIVSYYTVLAPEMKEVEFINAILSESNCKLLLDVNNIYVNGFNHGYNPYGFLDELDLSNVAYIHMAGHEKVAPDLIIDTHGQAIIDPVYDLFEYTVNLLNKDIPVLLERDFNIPGLDTLQYEMDMIRRIKEKSLVSNKYAARYENI